MKKNIAMAALLAAFFAACNKSDDLKGDEKIGGRLFWYNPYNGDIQGSPLAKKRVFVAYHPSDTLNYIYSVLTDANGYFVFTNLDKKQKYDVFYQDTIGNIKYSVFIDLLPGYDTISLLAAPDRLRQNGISVTAADTRGNLLQNIQVIAYDNHAIFLSDSAALAVNAAATTNGIHTFKTNQYGYDSWFNIAPRTYYLIAPQQAGGLPFAGTGTVTVSQTGIMPVPVVLAPVAAMGSMRITVLDKNGNAAAGIPLYLYTSSEIADADTTARSAYGYRLASKNNGIADTVNILPATYYIRTEKKVGTTLFKGSSTITVQPQTINQDTIIIQ